MLKTVFDRNSVQTRTVLIQDDMLHAITNIITDYQQAEEYKKGEKESKDIQTILTSWYPLGSRSKEISNLDNYFTEANDILRHIKTQFFFPKEEDMQARTVKIFEQY